METTVSCRLRSGAFVRAAIAAAAAVLASGAGAAPATVELPGARAFPESVTSTADGTLYVSNIDGGGVLRIRPGEAPATFIAPGAFGTRSTFGVLADEAAGLLWVCSNDASAIGLPGPSKVEGSWVKGFDLATGEGKVSARLPGPKTICNDIAIGPDRAPYVTNTLAPQILRLTPDQKAMEVWAEDPALAPDGGPGLDGIAFGGDGSIYVDKYGSGDLLRVAVADGKAGAVTRLATSPPLKLPDGLRPLGGGTFLLAEGGGQLDRISVDGDRVEVEVLRDGFIQATAVTVVAGTAWVADGQLSRLQGQAPALPFRLHAVPLAAAPVSR